MIGAAVPNWISFSNNTSNLKSALVTVFTMNTAVNGTYPIEITTFVNDGVQITSDTVTFNITLVSPCLNATYIPPVLNDIRLSYLGPLQNYSFGPFVDSVS